MDAAWVRKPMAARGRACQWQHGLLPGERVAQDVRGEPRGGFVRLARPNADRRQAQRNTLKEAAARVVGERQLRDRLLRAVTRQRRGEELVAHPLRDRRAEDGDGGGEDQSRPVRRLAPLLPDGLEDVPRPVEIDAIAPVEIGFRFARHDRRQVEDDVRPRGDAASDGTGIGNVRARQ
jgi:hypothetical protein